MGERENVLAAMGVDVWVRRESRAAPLPAAVQTAETASAAAVVHVDDDATDWASLRAQVATCTACDLHRSRTQTVFGVGSERADWLVIGEAPGAEEDRRGEPFVGRAGKLLDAMLAAAGLAREDVFIANILKCRPPNNRDPQPAEVVACEGFLARQIELLAPRLIVALGRVAAQNLLKSDTPIGKMRGRLHYYGKDEIPVVVTYHPAYLLRSPLEKRKSWQDLRLALEVCRPTAGGVSA